MKNLISNPFRIITTASLLLCCLLANHAGAVTTTWDPVGTATVANSHGFTSVSLNGTWENASWSTAQGGQVTPQAWVENSAAVWAVHSGTGTPAFTVTMNANHTVAGMFSGPLTYNPCTATIQGTGTMLLPAGLQGFSFNSNNSDPGMITIATVMADADPAHPAEYTAQGSGQVFLHANNTWSGGTLLGYSGSTFSGIVNFNNTGSFGTGGICISNTGTLICALVAEGSAAMTIANNFTNPASALPKLHIVAPSGGLTFTGEWDVNGDAQVGPSAGTVTFSGVVKGAGGVGTCPGVGSPTKLVLSGVNTYTGGTTNWLGTLSVNTIGDSTPSAIGTSSTANLAFCGGTFQYTGAGAALTARPCWLTAASTIDLTAGSLELSGAFKSTAGATQLTKTSAGKLILSGSGDNSSLAVNVSAGTVVLNKTSSGSVHALGGASTVSGGTLQLGSTGGGGDQIYSGVILTVSSGAFDMNGQSESMTTLILNGTGISSAGALVNSAASTVSTITGTAASGITLNANSSIGGAGSITVPSGTVITGTKSLTKVGAATLTLSGANNYSGGTIVSGGTLLVNNASGSATGTSTVTVNSPGTLAGTGIISGATTVNAGGTLTMVDAAAGETLHFGANLSLAGTTSLEIEQDLGIADEVVSGGIITLGGNLTVVQTDIGDAFVLGDTFQLFGGTLAGHFTSFTLPTLPAGLAWNTSQLGVGGNGTISVICDGTLVANAGAGQAICFGSMATLGGSPTASGGSGPATYTYSWSPNTGGLSSTTAANPTASPTTTTTYTVTVTDVNGCTAMSSVTVTAGATAIGTQPANQTACNGSTATFSVAATGAGLGYSWAKNNNNGWGSVWTVTGSGAAFLQTSAQNDQFQPSCNSFGPADIDSPVSGLALAMWGGSGGDEVATRDFTALTAGQVVSIDFDNGNVDNSPVAKVGFSLQTAGGAADVLQFYFVGGQANYKYWDTNLGEQDTGIPWTYKGVRVEFALINATTYGLVVTPCGGTAITVTGSGTYSGPIARVKLFNGNTAGGDPDNIYFNNFVIGGYSDNADNYTGGWAGLDKGNQPIVAGNGGSTYTTPVLTTGDNGSQYQVTVYGCGGSVASTVATLTVNPSPTAAVSGSATICNGGSTTISAALTGTGPWNVTWSDGPVQNNVASSPATRNVSPSATTTYTVTALTDTASGCTAQPGDLTGSAVVTVNPRPTAVVSGSATICNGDSTTVSAALTGTGPWNVTWSDSTVQNGVALSPATLTVSPSATTTYTVTALTDANCTAQAGDLTGSAAVTVNQKSADPTSATAGASTICNGGSTTLTLNGGGGGTGEAIKWYTVACGDTAAATGQGASVSPAVTTTYYGRYEDGAPCNYSSACATVTVTVSQKSANPTSATAGASTICNGGSTTLTLNGGGGGTGESIQWYTGSCGGTAVGAGNGLSVSPTATTTYYGRYEDGAPCNYNSACATVTVTVNQESADPTSATAGASTICNGGSTTLTLNGGGGGTGESIQWYTGSCGGTAAATGQGASVSPTATTTYYGRYEDGAPCNYNSACVQVTVTVNQKSADPTSATAASPTICNGGSTTLTLNGGGGGTGESIQWYTGSCGGTAAGAGNGLSVSPTATTTYYGRYEDGAPCNYNSACAQVTVTVNQKSADPTSATAGASTICTGTSTTLTLNGGGGGTGETIQWYTDSCGGTAVGAGNGLSVSPTATTTYYGRYEDGAPCNYNSACETVTVTVIPLPEITSNTLSGTDVVLVWTSLAGVNYQVQWTADLTAPITWTDLPGGPFTGSPTATATDSSGLGAQRFYRISVDCP